MNAMAAPVHEATVSSELRDLVLACQSASGAGQGPRVVSQTAKPVPENADAPWIQLSLRRDGARPLRLRGLLIHRTEALAPDGSRRLQLFATEDGSAVAQLVYEPAAGVAARPVFRVEPVRDAGELRLFIDRAAGDRRSPLAREEDLGGTGAPVPPAALRLPSDPPGLALSEYPRLLDCEGNHS